MSRVFGEMRQVAYVTRDIEADMRRLAESYGIGPWFYADRIRMLELRYRGEPSAIEMSAAIANSGGLQFELIEQRNEAPSCYRDWLRRHPEGCLVQHLSSWVEDYEATLARAAARGFEIVQEGRSGYGPFVYLARPEEPDLCVEVTPLTPPRRFIFEAVAAAARDWDGTDPIRRGWPVPPP